MSKHFISYSSKDDGFMRELRSGDPPGTNIQEASATEGIQNAFLGINVGPTPSLRSMGS